MLHVHLNKRADGAYVASINKQHPAVDGYQPQLPWLLLLADGRVRRFPSLSDAKDEALKRWAPCGFKRT